MSEDKGLPDKIGPYKIEAMIEKGGMSRLYLGIDPNTQNHTTIKVLLPKFLSRPDVVQRFLNEAEIIGMTNHPNIIKLYGHGEWERGLYIAMEYIHGVSLRQYLLQTPLSLKKALGIIIDIAYALCHLHMHGVIHRDLKPENILVTDTGGIKVIDFGIAQLLTEKDPSNESERQMLIGTPVYISPEQRDDPESVSFPSDIYSLGIIAYELILGKLSHGKVHISLMPRGMQKILQKCLLPDPDLRYQDIVDFITDTSSYLNSSEIEKESRAHDKLSELSEELQQVQKYLIPSTPPKWNGVNLGVECRTGIGISGVYYDFFELPGEKFGVLLSESSTRGAEGIIYAATFRGMVRSLFKECVHPADLASHLNELMFVDPLAPVFTMAYLILSPKENLLEYASCGFGELWVIKKGETSPEKHSPDNLALGIEKNGKFSQIELSWKSGDTVLLNTFGLYTVSEIEDQGFKEEQFIQAFSENRLNPPEQQVKNIVRKSQVHSSSPSPNRTIALINIQRH